jgi:hypothetical protein
MGVLLDSGSIVEVGKSASGTIPLILIYKSRTTMKAIKGLVVSRNRMQKIKDLRLRCGSLKEGLLPDLGNLILPADAEGEGRVFASSVGGSIVFESLLPELLKV